MKKGDIVKLIPHADPTGWASGLTREQIHTLEDGATISACDQGTQMIISFVDVPYALPMDMFVPVNPYGQWIEIQGEKLPRYFRDSNGVAREIQYPKRSKLLFRLGSVSMWKTGKAFSVLYGLSTIGLLTQDRAAIEFGHSCLHEAQCEGKLD